MLEWIRRLCASTAIMGAGAVSLLAEEVPPELTLNFACPRPLQLVAPLCCLLPQHAAQCLTNDKENLCLYSHPDGSREVLLPTKEVLLELMLGINLGRHCPLRPVAPLRHLLPKCATECQPTEICSHACVKGA